MSDTLHIRPAPGKRVLDPETLGFLPKGGDRVINSKYWQRRLLDGSVVKMDVAPAASPSRAGKKEA